MHLGLSKGYHWNINHVLVLFLNGSVNKTDHYLLKKLEKRDKKKFEELKSLNLETIEPNPVFRVIDGEVEKWEKLKTG